MPYLPIHGVGRRKKSKPFGLKKKIVIARMANALCTDGQFVYTVDDPTISENRNNNLRKYSIDTGNHALSRTLSSTYAAKSVEYKDGLLFVAFVNYKGSNVPTVEIINAETFATHKIVTAPLVDGKQGNAHCISYDQATDTYYLICSNCICRLDSTFTIVEIVKATIPEYHHRYKLGHGGSHDDFPSSNNFNVYNGYLYYSGVYNLKTGVKEVDFFSTTVVDSRLVNNRFLLVTSIHTDTSVYPNKEYTRITIYDAVEKKLVNPDFFNPQSATRYVEIEKYSQIFTNTTNMQPSKIHIYFDHNARRYHFKDYSTYKPDNTLVDYTMMRLDCGRAFEMTEDHLIAYLPTSSYIPVDEPKVIYVFEREK